MEMNLKKEHPHSLYIDRSQSLCCTPETNTALEINYQIRSDQISRSVVSNFLRPHESQHARPLCPSPTPGVHSDSRPSSQ